MKIHEKTITQKVMINLIISIVLIMTIAGSFFYLSEKEKALRELQKTADQISNRIANSLIYPLWNFSNKEIEEALSLEMSDDIILAIILRNERNQFLMGKIKDNQGHVANYYPSETQDIKLKKNMFSVKRKIVKNLETLGNVELFIANQHLNQYLQKLIIRVVLLTLILSIVIVVIIFFSLKKIILNPLGVLQRAVQRLDAAIAGEDTGNHRVTIGSGDEIDMLEKSFNTMADNLISSQRLLQQTVNRLQTLRDTTPDAIMRINPDGKIIDPNKTCIELSGYTYDELLNSVLSDLGAETVSGNVIRDNINRVIQGELVDFEWLLRRKDGEILFVIVRFRLMKVGDEYSILAVITDITDRMQAENALRESEEQYRIAIEATSDGVVIVQNDVHVYANQAFLDMFRYDTLDEIVGKEKYCIVHPDDYERVVGYAQARQQGEYAPVRYEFQGIRKDGTPIGVEASVNTISYKGEKAILAYLRDTTERKEADEALRRAEERYRSIFENAVEGIFQTVPEGQFLNANPALAKIFRYDSPKALMTSIVNIGDQLYVDPEQRREHIGILNEKGSVKNFETKMYRKDGSIFWAFIDTRTVRDNAGQPLYYEGFLVDITERKEAEEALQDSEERYKSLFQDNHAVMLLIDPETASIVDANPTACKYYGWSREEITRKKITDINVLIPTDVFFEMQLAREEKRDHFIFKHRLSNGEIRDVEVFSGPIHSKGRNLLYSIVHDITVRKQLERTLREERAGFRLVSENAPVGIAVIDKDGIFKYINPTFKEYFGYDLEDIHDGKMWLRKAYPDPAYRHKVILTWMNNIRGTITKKPIRWVFEVRCKDGSDKTIGFVTVHLGEGSHIMTCEDITERKQAEEALLRAQKLESLGILAGGIAHDFNNLMVVLLGYVELAMMGLPVNHTSYPLLKAALQSTEQAKDLTSRLITFSRGDLIIKQLSNIGEVLRETVRKMITGDAIEVIFDIENNLWQAEVDEVQIRQVFYNLAVNAVEAMPQGGTLTIKAENIVVHANDEFSLQQGSYLKITFVDNGIGVAEENLVRIFDPYFTTKNMGAEKGVGLGLSVCYSVIKKHRGHIAVLSRPGKGAAFTLYLPVPVEKIRKAPPPLAVPRYRVLIMEDEATVRMLERAFLAQLGCEVVETSDGQEAINRYKEAMHSKKPFDLVILDLIIRQGMGGQQTMEGLLKEDPSVKAVIVSGYVDDQVIEHYRNYGFRKAMKKPFRLQELQEVIAEVMDGKT